MGQRTTTIGDGNTIVQIEGDGNTVLVGPPHLVLTRYLGRREIRNDLDRLSPYTRSIPLVGRDAELVSLRAFLALKQPIAARVMTGGGGSGKTRLALELCDALSEEGWAAGFVGRSEIKRFLGQQNLSTRGWSKPTLIVVDYAAEHAQVLSQWFEELADRVTPAKHPLRILLLERSASTETGWWTVVFASGGWGSTGKRALLDPPEPVAVEPLATADFRLGVLKAMLSPEALANLGATLDEESLRQQLLQSPWGGDPLFLMMAAMAMSQSGSAKALSLGRADLAEELAGREADRLRHLAGAGNVNPDLVQHLAAVVTLTQGMNLEDFENIADAEKQAIRRQSGGDVADLVDLMQQALPHPNGIAPVLPDLIGEALVIRTFRDEAGTRAVLRNYQAFGQPVVETAVRAAQDYSPGRTQPLAWLRAIAQSVSKDDPALTALNASLPMGSVALRDINLEVARLLADLRRDSPNTAPETKAAALNGLAIALAEAGQREPALHAAQEAANLYRQLADLHPDAFRPDLALSLNNLANTFSNLGQREPALLAAQEAADLYRQLADLRPDVFRPNLALSLNNLANTLSDLDQREPALLAAQEAADLYRQLADLRPDVFRPNLAATVNNLASRLSDLGQPEPALLAAQEAADLSRQLADLRPDVFRPDLAASLQNLANMLSALGQREPALLAAQEATDLYRQLADLRPDVFRHNLAASLYNLANRLSDLGQPEPALLAAQEAADLYRQLADLRPDVFRPILARSLIVLARRTEQTAGAGEAAPIAHAAIDALSPHFLKLPDAFRELMGSMAGDYIRLVKAAGAEPDLDLLAPLLPYFQPQE